VARLSVGKPVAAPETIYDRPLLEIQATRGPANTTLFTAVLTPKNKLILFKPRRFA
jgi:hypothetical protein